MSRAWWCAARSRRCLTTHFRAASHVSIVSSRRLLSELHAGLRRHRRAVSRSERAQRAQARTCARRCGPCRRRGRLSGRRVHARGNQARRRRIRACRKATGAADGEAAARPGAAAVAARCGRRARRRDLSSALDATGFGIRNARFRDARLLEPRVAGSRIVGSGTKPRTWRQYRPRTTG